jgi:hypothetical protein
MTSDLETALEVEAARAGSTEGEATTVLKAVRPKRHLLRGRGRSIAGALAVLALAGAAIAAVIVISEGGGGGGGGAEGGSPIAISSATDYDPYGDGSEHSEEVQLAIDGNPTTTSWTTETYETGPEVIKEAVGGPSGVGLYLDAGREASAGSLEVRSEEPGWDLTVYGSAGSPPEDLDDWTEIGNQTDMGTHETIRLEGGERFRYYLLWITKLAETDEGYAVEISDTRLFS